MDEKEKYKNTLENIINELKQRLEHADRLAAIGNLFAMASHEINNKITSISGNIALLKKLCEKNKYDPQIILEITKRLSCSVQGFSDIIKSVLSFGKTHKNDSKKLISITQCLEQTKIITSILFKKMGIRIIMENETENLFINGIRNEIIHLFINIFINAADAMKDKAHKNFHVKTYSTEKKIIMRFSDSGCGITDISHAEIWEPFYTTKGAAGSGLGLTIAKKIAEKHGGLISASNQAGGEGAVFTLELPKVKIHKLSPA
ncbi:MAG: sensor histidine kinase [Fibrobacterota bacterium]